MGHKIAVGLLLFFGIGGMVSGIIVLFGIVHPSRLGNQILVGIGAILNGFVITRFALRQARMKDRTA